MTSTIIRVLLLHILTSSLTVSSLRNCTEGDICQAITLSQLALSEIQSDIRILKAAYNSSMGMSMTNTNDEAELTACSLLNSDLTAQVTALQDQVTSLEEKNGQLMSSDHGIDDEKETLQRDIERLNEFLKSMNTEKLLLEKTIKRQTEQIKKLSISLHRPVDCADIQVLGQTESGVYSIYPTQTESESINVMCDLKSNDGGWTVFLHRQPQDEPMDFNESWEEFRDGFGNVNTEYWLGNDVLHILTSLGPSTLRVDAENFLGEKKWAEWNIFDVADEENKYQLSLKEYDENSILGDSFSRNMSFFTTYDSDYDSRADINCAVGSTYSYWGKGGWWYAGCGSMRPTAPIKNTDYWDSACWLKWNRQGNQLTSIKNLSMKFRRHNYLELAVNSI